MRYQSPESGDRRWSMLLCLAVKVWCIQYRTVDEERAKAGSDRHRTSGKRYCIKARLCPTVCNSHSPSNFLSRVRSAGPGRRWRTEVGEYCRSRLGYPSAASFVHRKSIAQLAFSRNYWTIRDLKMRGTREGSCRGAYALRGSPRGVQLQLCSAVSCRGSTPGLGAG
jgi:hypothetical protein